MAFKSTVLHTSGRAPKAPFWLPTSPHLIFSILTALVSYSSTTPAPIYHSHEKITSSRKFNRTSTRVFLQVTCSEVPLPLQQSLASEVWAVNILLTAGTASAKALLAKSW